MAVNKTARPRRWDIVAYRDASARGQPVYCGRIVALPGETMTFDGRGGLLIDGKPVTAPPPVLGRYFAASSGPARHLARYADGEAIHLSDQQVFFIGDNVDMSYDSRFTGPADISLILGVVDAVYWPATHMRVLGW